MLPSRTVPRKAMEEHLVNWFMRHCAVAWGILAVAAVGVCLCFMYMPKTQLPEMTYDDAVMSVDWNGQVSLEENAARVDGLEKAVSAGAVQVTSMVGTQQFILSHSKDLNPSEASVYVKCRNSSDLDAVRRSAAEYMSAYPSATWSFGMAGNLFDMVFGQDEPELAAAIAPNYVNIRKEPSTEGEVLGKLY